MNIEQQITLEQFDAIKERLEVEQRVWKYRLENDPIWKDERGQEYCKGRIEAYENAVWIVQQHLETLDYIAQRIQEEKER